MKLFVPIVAAAALAAMAAPSASAAVIGATVADASSGNYTLTSVSVTRGSAGTFTYVPSQLTGVDLTDVGASGSPILVPGNASLPAPGTRATLLEDGRLDTGVINPVSTGVNDVAFSFEVTFLNPVVNSDGEDILVLEAGSGDPTRFYANGNAAQSFDVIASNFSGALLSSVPNSLYRYNNSGDTVVDDLDELESTTGYSLDTGAGPTTNIVALGLDLSSFGIPVGATVNSLRFQSVGTARIDPVLIVGLPAVPEPASAALAAVVLSGGLLLRRRTRRA